MKIRKACVYFINCSKYLYNITRTFITRVYESKAIKNKKFIIISNNCWGYKLYQDLNLEYNTPFIGLFILPNDYIKLLENLEWLALPIQFESERSDYPVGKLGEIEIHFLHYKTQEEAKTKWERRVKRFYSVLDTHTLFVKFCTKDGFDEEVVARFMKLPYKKIMFTTNKSSLKKMNNCHEMVVLNALPDGALLYRDRYRYFDIATWINSGTVNKSFICKLLEILK